MEARSINGRICYKSTCIKCGIDRGFVRKAYLYKECKTCSNGQKMLGKTSPKKGVKTNKPAWNKGKKFSLISEEQKRIKHSMRTALNIRLKKRNLSKSRKASFSLLQYSAQELISHLESKFQPGMTWDNYGEWHIDHITPDSWFKYDSIDSEEFKKSWALSNLQPMWAKDNLVKSNKFSGGFCAKSRQ